MAYIMYNANPEGNRTVDCSIRAVSLLLGQSWDETFIGVMCVAYKLKDMPITDVVWRVYLKKRGYFMTAIPNTCPDCYTVKDFCKDFPYGRYLLKVNGHVVTVVDGDYYDTWDSGNEIPIYFYSKGV